MDHVINQYYLQQMGIDVWCERTIDNHSLLSVLQKKVAQCQRCTLCQSRTQTVFARGNPQAKLMIVGEAPGFYEDQRGLPFVGKAGMLLDRMLKSIDLSENDVYIANILKCRPPNNRDPSPEEILQCTDYLIEQINLVKPKILLALGRFSGQFLTNSSKTLGQMRQEIHYYQSTQCIVSYHPAYLLRNPQDKKKSFDDLLKIKHLL